MSSSRLPAPLVRSATGYSRPHTAPFVRHYATPNDSQISDAMLNSSVMRKLSSNEEVMQCVANVMMLVKEKGYVSTGGAQPTTWSILKMFRDKEIQEAMVALKEAMDRNGIVITMEEYSSIAKILASGTGRRQ
ncbi:hypothetical protein LIPSTDRAFT_74916 [Lipomyces starkeyi NRRL Y-11557]|uniref:Uncharacterized protein n=1 Tax=Lipomyces starkeyi NRRL Y-11557 TaxID=675824 RepID=A0A1E3Q0N2_LIPST|nr:hypothetical protein LIPSTDRAFT_74916 [Lipomyces starkeyi NRRL Y-11557]